MPDITWFDDMVCSMVRVHGMVVMLLSSNDLWPRYMLYTYTYYMCCVTYCTYDIHKHGAFILQCAVKMFVHIRRIIANMEGKYIYSGNKFATPIDEKALKPL